MTMSSAYDITAKVKPPRAAFLNFPLGNSVGRPNEPEEQRAILTAALGLLESASEPGAMVELPFRWPDDDDPATGERRNYAALEALAVARLI